MIEGVGIFGLDGCPGNRPATVQARQDVVVRRVVDIEMLLQWALARTGRLPWCGVQERELAFDRGCTARPRRREQAGWALAEACAGLRLGNGRPLPAMMEPGPDALRVLAAVRRLDDPQIAGVVVACARARIRPDWMPGVEPAQVRRWVRCRKRHRAVVRLVWEPCDPAAIRAARELYAGWQRALLRLAAELDGQLDGWRINGLAAPAAPWRDTVAKIA